MIYFLTLTIIFAITIIISALFITLDNKFNLKAKYFNLVTKNKILYYLIFIIWIIILFILLMISFQMNNYKLIILVVYFAIFINIYNHKPNWKIAQKNYHKKSK